MISVYKDWKSPHDTYMFSKKEHLACIIEEDGKYYVCNGDWRGTRNGDDFTIHTPNIGTDITRTIVDWAERSLHDISDEDRARWYLPRPMSMYDRFEQLEREEDRKELWDSDIPF